MSEDNELENFKDDYKYEIRSIKRTIEKFDRFRSWLITTSLASLAFVLTFLLQIRLETELPCKWLAMISVGSLLLAVSCSIYTKFNYEMSGISANSKDFAKLFSAILESARNSETEPSEEELQQLEIVREKTAEVEKMQRKDNKFTPFEEVWLFSANGIALGAGVAAASMYFWSYLFG